MIKNRPLKHSNPNMKTQNNDCTILASRLSANVTGTADQVLVGLNWTVVVGPLGVGLSHSPARGTNGCNGLPAPGSYAGQKLMELTRLTASENVFEQAIGYAAINAHHNRFDLQGSEVNGLDLIEDYGEQTVVIGQFPGLMKRVPNAAIIEREPGPGCYPEEAAADLLPAAKQVLITGSALTNGSLAGLLPIARQAFVALVGPSCPLNPLLFEFGIDAISGFVVRNTEALLHVAMEGGAVAAMRPHGRFLTLARE
jgi:uncharacterized protein (DUF4213/DUF364 family)